MKEKISVFDGLRKFSEFAMIFVIIVVLFCITNCRACVDIMFPGPEDYLPEFENEYYKYAVKTQSNGEKTGYIVDLTELGQSQTELILPENIDGVRIVGFGYERKENHGWFYEQVGNFKSETLTRLYVPFDSKEAEWSHAYEHSQAYCYNCYIVMWKDLRITGSFKAEIISYNLLTEYFESNFGYLETSLLANVSYMYNYEDAEDDGYYWVDSYNNSLIGFIPPEPEREGYSFDGWYKEPQCENAWDFEADKTGNEIELRSKDIDDYDVQDITYLYAKWIKN